ncbi:MAG: cobyrinate a,c-diamide synthase [Clostridia bacterium]|nr:cobyrinate a,c-diamide synthase [Clostridia bacterium]
MSGIMIAGVSSGSGKTTFTMGLMHVIKKRGFNVRAFKTGPDYIDPMFHRHVLKDRSYNLPLWIINDETIKSLYLHSLKKGDIPIVEGVMGYYDGHSGNSDFGSSSHLAELLDLSVIIMMDASHMALTAAAIIKGLHEFKTPSKIRGVIFNNINSFKHYTLLKEAVESHTSVQCYGYLERNCGFEIKSRHLGLLQAEEISDLDQRIEAIGASIETTVNIQKIMDDCLKKANQLDDFSLEVYDLERLNKIQSQIKGRNGLKLGIAMDEAFSFYYDHNLELLLGLGVELIPFSPLKDKVLPVECDALYIGGGYPEVFADVLEANESFRNDIKDKMLSGLPVYAECGGLMYLAESITNLDGKKNAMVGYFDAEVQMTSRLQHFGHVEAVFTIGQSKIVYRGHEFHKSLFLPLSHIDTRISVVKSDQSWTCGYNLRNTIATYVHNHFYSNLEFLEFLVGFWIQNKE